VIVDPCRALWSFNLQLFRPLLLSTLLSTEAAPAEMMEINDGPH
jgi:hypothetical protein